MLLFVCLFVVVVVVGCWLVAVVVDVVVVVVVLVVVVVVVVVVCLSVVSNACWSGRPPATTACNNQVERIAITTRCSGIASIV